MTLMCVVGFLGCVVGAYKFATVRYEAGRWAVCFLASVTTVFVSLGAKVATLLQ
jgi:hypothetical protein